MREPFSYDNPEHMEHFAKTRSDHLWFYFPQWNLSLLTPTKCGTSSVKQFIWMNELEDVKRIKHHEVTGELFVTVRDPISRFCSLWRSKCRDKANLRDKRVHGMSPNELMTHIESGAKDVHWTPQVDMIGNLNPTLIPVEHFTKWWAARGYGELGVFNATVAADNEITDVDPKRILSFYAADMGLYMKAILKYQ